MSQKVQIDQDKCIHKVIKIIGYCGEPKKDIPIYTCLLCNKQSAEMFGTFLTIKDFFELDPTAKEI